jgi:hypothetical protein
VKIEDGISEYKILMGILYPRTDLENLDISKRKKMKINLQ